MFDKQDIYYAMAGVVLLCISMFALKGPTAGNADGGQKKSGNSYSFVTFLVTNLGLGIGGFVLFVSAIRLITLQAAPILAAGGFMFGLSIC